jgi:hypothetical protein
LYFQGGYRGFYSKNTINLTPKVVNDIHKRGGTFLCTSRGGHDANKIVDNIQDRRINQVDMPFSLVKISEYGMRPEWNKVDWFFGGYLGIYYWR